MRGYLNIEKFYVVSVMWYGTKFRNVKRVCLIMVCMDEVFERRFLVEGKKEDRFCLCGFLNFLMYSVLIW